MREGVNVGSRQCLRFSRLCEPLAAGASHSSSRATRIACISLAFSLCLIGGLISSHYPNSNSDSTPAVEQTYRQPTKREDYDLSATYARVNKTIFNKTTGVVFATPAEFFEDSLKNSFSNLEFDTLLKRPRGV